MNGTPGGRAATGRVMAARRGAALTETALLMVVLMPLLFYAVFLMDEEYLKLDLQETVVSGLWDFSTRNVEASNSYTKANKDADWQQVARGVRFAYADHTSAYDDGADPQGPGLGDPDRLRGKFHHAEHHKIYFAAQYTFRFPSKDGTDEDDDDGDGNLSGPDTEFQCSMVDELDWAKDPVILKGFAGTDSSPTNPGGKIKCEATGFIYNYIIPESFDLLSKKGSSTSPPLTTLTRYGADVDAHSIHGDSGKNIKAHESGALFYNTWALRTGSASGKLDSGADIGDRSGATSYANLQDNPFYDRVVKASTQGAKVTYDAVDVAAEQFAQEAQTQKLMNVAVAPHSPTKREEAGLPTLSGVVLVSRYKPGAPGQTKSTPVGLLGGGKYQSTPYRGINPDYSNAYGHRGMYYMGCNQAEQSVCH